MTVRNVALGSSMLGFILIACVGDTQTVSPSPPDAGGDSAHDASIVDASTTDTNSTADSSNAPDGSDAAAPWTPAKLGQSLTLWLDGAKFKGNSWPDSSGNNNNASVGMGTPTASTVAGLPSVHFTGGNKATTMAVLSSSSMSNWNTTSVLVEVVGQFGSGNKLPMLFDKAANGGPGLRISLDVPSKVGNVEIGGSVYTSLMNAPIADGMKFRVWASFVNGTLLFGVGGASVTKTGSPPGGDTAGLTLGNYQTGAMPGVGQFDGDVAEVIIVDPLPLDPDRAALETYLQTKYGVP